MDAPLDAEAFVAHTKAMELLAIDAWYELDAYELSLLQGAGLGREWWAIAFGHRLFSLDLGRHGLASSTDEADARGASFPMDDLRKLASSFARRASTPGGLSWSEVPMKTDVFKSVAPQPPSRDVEPPGHDAETPFDPILRRTSRETAFKSGGSAFSARLNS